MARKCAVKRLTASDLTFFEWQFRNENAGNQKAINLNADVFVGVLYPSLPGIAMEQHWRLPLDLFVYGPGLAEEHNLQRKIIKGGTYKNWRLDGEFIHNPDASPERFNSLTPGDCVVFEFGGDVNYPTSAKAVFLAAAEAEDVSLHQEMDSFLKNKKMAPLSSDQLRKMVDAANPSSAHPIRELFLEADLEDAAQGGLAGTNRLLTRPSGKRISQGQLQEARQNAGSIGRIGEEFVNVYFAGLKDNSQLSDYEWTSDENAISPYDFKKISNEGETILVDVKSTKEQFDGTIHISMNELRQMRSGPERYDLYRVFEIKDSNAKLRIAKNVRGFAQDLINALKNLQDGIIPDSFSVLPRLLPFEQQIELNIPDEKEAEGQIPLFAEPKLDK